MKKNLSQIHASPRNRDLSRNMSIFLTELVKKIVFFFTKNAFFNFFGIKKTIFFTSAVGKMLISPLPLMLSC